MRNGLPILKQLPALESNEELKLTKQVFALATEEDNNFVKLLSKFVYWKTLRVIVCGYYGLSEIPYVSQIRKCLAL